MQLMATETLNFRKNLGSLCAEYGAVQRIATQAGISRVFLSRIIHGHATPTIEVAASIARAAGLSLSDLIGPPEKLSKKFAHAS